MLLYDFYTVYRTYIMCYKLVIWSYKVFDTTVSEFKYHSWYAYRSRNVDVIYKIFYIFCEFNIEIISIVFWVFFFFFFWNMFKFYEYSIYGTFKLPKLLWKIHIPSHSVILACTFRFIPSHSDMVFTKKLEKAYSTATDISKTSYFYLLFLKV